MNILIVHNKYQLAGGEDVVAKNDGLLLSSHGNNVFYYERDNHELEGISFVQKIRYALGTIYSRKSYQDIIRIIEANQIDVVHVHNVVPLISFSVYYAAKKKKCRLIQSIHNFRLLCPMGMMVREGRICERCIEKSLFQCAKYGCYKDSKVFSSILAFSIALHRILGTFRKVDNYIVTTDFNNKMLQKVVPANRIVKIPYYSDNEIRPLTEKKMEYYVYASRVERMKGIFIALEAFSKLPNQRLLVLGTGPDEEKAKDYVAQNQMKNVEFLGFQSMDSLRNYLYNAKALVFPTQWYEGYPMTIVESLSLGTPVIGSNIGNVGTIVEDGVNGYHFQYDSSESLVEVIQLVENDESQLHKMIQGAQDYFIQIHSEDSIYKKIMSVYGE